MSKKLAVITGGASGIGEATAHRLSADGYRIAVLDMNVERGKTVSAALEAKGGSAKFFKCDVGDIADVERVASLVEKDLGVPEVLVTSAGLIPNTEGILDMDLDAHERMWRVNYHGTVYTCRVFGKQMIATRRGAIVTIGSINSYLPLPLPAYNPGKAAIQRLTQLLAVELGRHGIRVNSVAPTYVLTPPLKAKIEAGQRDLGKIMSVHALDRLPEPADIANAIAFLCSDQATAITGVLLPVDSGWLSAVSYKTYAGGVPWQDE